MADNRSPFTKKIHSGLSIHSHSVRGVMVNEKGAITGFGEVLFEHPILTDDITDPKPLIQAFNQIKSRAKFTSPYVAVCFPEKYAFSRQYQLPQMESAEINEAIGWQIEKIFPFAQKDIYYDWKLLERDDKHTIVLVTAVPRNLLDHIRICLEQTGLYPISFEPSALAIGRILPPAETGTSLILEVDSNTACLTLVVNRTSIATSTHNLESLGQPGELFYHVKSSLYTMIHKYAPTTVQTPQSIKIYLTGEKATADLSQSLSSFFGLPVIPLTVSNVAPAYHLAYIAAKSHILPPGSEKTVNLLPTVLQTHYIKQLNREQSLKNLKTTIYFAIPTLVICALTYLIIQAFNVTINKAIVSARAATEIPNLAGLNLADINKNSQTYINLFPLKITPENYLYQILSHLPPNITLTKISYDAKTKTYSLTGIAQDRVDLLNLKTALESLKLFKTVTLPLSAFEDVNRVNFTLSIVQKN